jgi:hypothetical protein
VAFLNISEYLPGLLHGCCTQNILLVILHSQGYASAPTCQHAGFHDLGLQVAAEII